MATDDTLFAPYVPPTGYTREQAYGVNPQTPLWNWGALGRALVPQGGTPEYLARRQAYFAPWVSSPTVVQPAHPLQAIAPTPFSTTTAEAPAQAQQPAAQSAGPTWGEMMGDLQQTPVRTQTAAPIQPSAVPSYMNAGNPAAVQAAAFAYGMSPQAAHQYLATQSATPDGSTEARAQQLVQAGVDPYAAIRQARAELMVHRPASWDRYLDAGIADADRQRMRQTYEQEVQHARMVGDADRLNALLAQLGNFAPYGERAVSLGHYADGQPYTSSLQGGQVRQLNDPTAYYGSLWTTPEQAFAARNAAEQGQAAAALKQQQMNAELTARLFGPLGPALLRQNTNSNYTLGNINAALHQIDAHRKAVMESTLPEEERAAQLQQLEQQYSYYNGLQTQMLRQPVSMAPAE